MNVFFTTSKQRVLTDRKVTVYQESDHYNYEIGESDKCGIGKLLIC